MRSATMLALVLALVACKKENKSQDTGGQTGQTQNSADTGGSGAAGSAAQGSAEPDATGSAAAGSAATDDSGGAGTGDVAMQRGAGKCPSTVLGATTRSEVKGKDVVLTITASDKDAIGAIQRRTEELLAAKAEGGTSGTVHDQKGSHGGGVGLCPVYWTEGGSATSKKDAKGVVVTITPKDDPKELKEIIDGRIAKASDWVKANIEPGDQGNKGAVGGGGGKHGSTHQGEGDGKGKDRREGGTGGGAGTGGGGGKGTGGGGKGDAVMKQPVKKVTGGGNTGGW
jgi:hypothetical protein